MPVIATSRRSASRRLARFRFDRRGAGLLLHPTSLPGPHGSGDLGPEARAFVDFLARAGQRWWQMLPVGPPGASPGNGPYGACSAFAGSVWLISPELLREEGLLDDRDLSHLPPLGEAEVNYRAMYRHRGRLLRRAFSRFQRGSGKESRQAEVFESFRARERAWLEDFGLFLALHNHHGRRPWLRWPADIKLRRPAALAAARRELAEPIRFHEFCQFLFDQQWARLRSYAHAKGVGLIGDLPLFVGLDSSDVWARPHLFLLEPDGTPKYLSGAPPDEFCPDGQRWGHPHYDWDAHRRSGFAWWVARFASIMSRFDGVRIDHFLGFVRAWGVAPRARSARKGTWLPGPGPAVFDAVKRALGDVPIIAEDLGLLTPRAAALRDRLGLPGMRVMQFGFGPDGDYHLPHRYPRRTVAYTGTHDNNTTAGWFDDLVRRNGHAGSAATAQREKLIQYLKASHGQNVPWLMIRALMASAADTVILPVQDILGLGEEARMNIPGVSAGQWKWRVPQNALTPALAARLRKLTKLYGRE